MRKLKTTELKRISVDEFKDSEKLPITVVLDNVRSMLNVGSAFRTSDAFRVEKVILCGITGRPPHREITKTALGATESVDWEYFENEAEALEKLNSAGTTILAIEQTDQSIELQNFEPRSETSYALVFGNEVEGVSDEFLMASSEALEIPQFGTKHSLNVSVSVGVTLWHFQNHYLASAIK